MSLSPDHGAAQHAAEIHGIIREASECADRLLSILEDERDALASSDVVRIDGSGQNKNICIAQLEDLERERLDMCRLLAIPNADFEAFLERHDDGGNTLPLWQQFLGKLILCREANAVNGQVARFRKRHVERALHILRGSEEHEHGLYGPKGLDNSYDVTHLGKA